MSGTRAELARAYAAALYTVELPAGRLELRIGAPPDGPVPSVPFAIVTAWNPGSSRPSAERNRAANERLQAALAAAGFVHYPAAGRSEDGTHEEPSFAVMDIGAAQALELARRFGQAAIVYWDGTGTRLLWCGAAVDLDGC